MLKGKCPHGASQVDVFGYFSDCPCRTTENDELDQLLHNTSNQKLLTWEENRESFYQYLSEME